MSECKLSRYPHRITCLQAVLINQGAGSFRVLCQLSSSLSVRLPAPIEVLENYIVIYICG